MDGLLTPLFSCFSLADLAHDFLARPADSFFIYQMNNKRGENVTTSKQSLVGPVVLLELGNAPPGKRVKNESKLLKC